MKFKSLDGTFHSKDIERYRWESGGASRGERMLGEKLRALFPNSIIYSQLPCVGTQLRIDFYIHAIKIAFEFDGAQHNTFNAHFHKTRRRFQRAKDNDLKKQEWCDVNGIELIRLTEEDLDRLEEKICGS